MAVAELKLIFAACEAVIIVVPSFKISTAVADTVAIVLFAIEYVMAPVLFDVANKLKSSSP